jgi:threonine/homoserine/homoserine lactone efflux protein
MIKLYITYGITLIVSMSMGCYFGLTQTVLTGIGCSIGTAFLILAAALIYFRKWEKTK